MSSGIVKARQGDVSILTLQMALCMMKSVFCDSCV